MKTLASWRVSYICSTEVFPALHVIPNQLQWLLEFKSHFRIHDMGPFVPSYKSRKALISFEFNCAVAGCIKRIIICSVKENIGILLLVLSKIGCSVRFIDQILFGVKKWFWRNFLWILIILSFLFIRRIDWSWKRVHFRLKEKYITVRSRTPSDLEK